MDSWALYGSLLRTPPYGGPPPPGEGAPNWLEPYSGVGAEAPCTQRQQNKQSATTTKTQQTPQDVLVSHVACCAAAAAAAIFTAISNTTPSIYSLPSLGRMRGDAGRPVVPPEQQLAAFMPPRTTDMMAGSSGGLGAPAGLPMTVRSWMSSPAANNDSSGSSGRVSRVGHKTAAPFPRRGQTTQQ